MSVVSRGRRRTANATVLQTAAPRLSFWKARRAWKNLPASWNYHASGFAWRTSHDQCDRAAGPLSRRRCHSSSSAATPLAMPATVERDMAFKPYRAKTVISPRDVAGRFFRRLRRLQNDSYGLAADWLAGACGEGQWNVAESDGKPPDLSFWKAL